MMRVAVLGAGFAGLAVSWFLLHYRLGSVSIDLFDPEPIGGGVSGLSSGLLHTYPGKKARRSWHADFCMRETHRLITEASRGIDQSVILSKGILRPALNEEQKLAFKRCAESHEDTQWWDYRRCTREIPGLVIPRESGGLYIKEGLTIDVQAYLQGLWQSIAKLGVQYHQSAAIGKHTLEKYDQILVAMGPMTKNFPSLERLPITPIKGQILDLKWPTDITPPSMSLNSYKYLVMSKDLKTCTCGATFEREFESIPANREKAIKDILPHITVFFPALKNAKIIRCRAGFRACSPTHLPLVGRVSEKVCFLTGLGSKGLLYHAWIAKRVARTMITGNTEYLPDTIRFEFPKQGMPHKRS